MSSEERGAAGLEEKTYEEKTYYVMLKSDCINEK